LKHAHPFEGQGVQKIDAAHEEVGNTEEEKEMAVKETPRVPGDHEDAAGNGDAEGFRQTVEEKIIIKAGQIQSDQRYEQGKGFQKWHRRPAEVQKVIHRSAIALLPAYQILFHNIQSSPLSEQPA